MNESDNLIRIITNSNLLDSSRIARLRIDALSNENVINSMPNFLTKCNYILYIYSINYTTFEMKNQKASN